MNNREQFNLWWDKEKEKWDQQFQEIFETIAWKTWEASPRTKRFVEFDGSQIILQRWDVIIRALSELMKENKNGLDLGEYRIVVGLVEK